MRRAVPNAACIYAFVAAGTGPPASQRRRKDKREPKKKEPKEPPSAKTAFHYFARQQRPQTKKESPELSNADISKRLQTLWEVLHKAALACAHCLHSVFAALQ
jgi:HMG (high mobility group) box